VLHTSRTLIAALATSALLLAACGAANQSTSSNAGNGTSTTSPSPSATPAAARPAVPTYRTLDKSELTKALLGLEDLPPGYSQDPPNAASDNKTFCDYKPPFTEEIHVSRDFTKGGGLSAEVLSVSLRQYANAQQAKAAFTALTDALAGCTGETYQGTKLTYAPMSVAKVGDGSVGVKITADGATLLQNFALVGPTLVTTGGGGLANANADQITSLLQEQVKVYESAAAQ
jgi:hypothetical protein